MIKLKKILVPTDFSEPSEAALRYAKAFAETFGASLHLLHAVESPMIHGWEVGDLGQVMNELKKNAEQRISELLTEDEKKKFHGGLSVVEGNPFVHVIQAAKEQDVDLIIMGTHGRGYVAQVLLGSVTERVVRKAPCPVLVVRHPEHEFVMP